MSLGSALMAAATGALQGRQAAQDKAERDQENNLKLLSVLSQLPGFSIGDVSGSQGGQAAPETPTVPTSPANAPALAAAAANPSSGTGPPQVPSILQGARSALGPNASAIAPAPAATPAGVSPAPRSLIRVGHLALGGSDEPIMFDPSRSAGALQTAREALNRQAYQALEAAEPGSQGTYDPSFDYAAARRTELQQQHLAEALVATGKYTPQEAALYAKDHLDLQDRELKRQEMQQRQQQLKLQAAAQGELAAQRAFDVKRLTAQDTQSALAQEATGLIESGADPATVGAALRALHPTASAQDITRAVGDARASASMRAAVIGQKDRSNQPKGQGGAAAALLQLLGGGTAGGQMSDTTGGRDLSIGTSAGTRATAPTPPTPTGPGGYTAEDVEMQYRQALAAGADPQAAALRRQQLLGQIGAQP